MFSQLTTRWETFRVATALKMSLRNYEISLPSPPFFRFPQGSIKILWAFGFLSSASVIIEPVGARATSPERGWGGCRCSHDTHRHRSGAVDPAIFLWHSKRLCIFMVMIFSRVEGGVFLLAGQSYDYCLDTRNLIKRGEGDCRFQYLLCAQQGCHTRLYVLYSPDISRLGRFATSIDSAIVKSTTAAKQKRLDYRVSRLLCIPNTNNAKED